MMKRNYLSTLSDKPRKGSVQPSPLGYTHLRFGRRSYVVKRRGRGGIAGIILAVGGLGATTWHDLIRGTLSTEGIGRIAVIVGVILIYNQRLEKRIDGKIVGLNKSYDWGHENGYEEGHEVGYAEGYEVGYAEGRRLTQRTVVPMRRHSAAGDEPFSAAERATKSV